MDVGDRMKKAKNEPKKKYKFLYMLFLFLIYIELIVFLQNVMFYESFYFNFYYLVFVILLLYTLKLEYYAINSKSVYKLVLVTVLIAINPIIKIFELFEVNFMDIPIYINVCMIIYKLIKGEINDEE